MLYELGPLYVYAACVVQIIIDVYMHMHIRLVT